MLGKTAGGLYWMFRYLERSENTARLLDAGLRMSLTRSSVSEDQWASVLATARVKEAYEARHGAIEPASVINFMLRERTNPVSVISAIDAARNNARLVRTALTREVWEATNEGWMAITSMLKRPVREREMPEILDAIRQKGAMVLGTLSGTMLRNDIYDFARIGTFLERADNTARILDVKYYVLLPSAFHVGSSLDNAQWESILRSVSANRAYRWLTGGETTPMGIAEFLLLDRSMPRSLAFCYSEIVRHLEHLAEAYGARHPCHEIAERARGELKRRTIEQVFDDGLHETLHAFIYDNNALGQQIEADYRFSE